MDDLELHDFEILDVNINYNDACVNVHLRSFNNKKCCLQINEFKKFQFSCEEPWGSGIYVNSSEILFIENNMRYKLTLELNSGDELIVISTKEAVLIGDN